jgi:hypothetical protein
MVMTDLLERTHHEPLVVRRLPSTADGHEPERPPRTRRRRAVTLAATAVATLVVGSWVLLGEGDPVEAPAPTVTLPAE